MTDGKARMYDFLDRHEDALMAFVRDLVQTPSDNPPGDCRAIAQTVSDHLQRYGFHVQHYPVPDLLVQAVNQIAVTNIVAQYPNPQSRLGPEIVLNAHGDVVPPGEGWTFPPYGGELTEGFLYGRGAAVSKSDIAAYTFAAMALQEVIQDVRGSVILAFTFDEETGGTVGPKWLLENNLIHPTWVIAPGFTHHVGTAHNGCLHMEVTVKGRSAHAAMPWSGIDALEGATLLLQRLYTYRTTLTQRISAVPGITSPSLVVGTISGGINTNVVPDRCVFRLDRRIIPEEDPQDVVNEIHAVMAAFQNEYPAFSVVSRVLLLARSLQSLPNTRPLIEALQINYQALTTTPLPEEGTPLYTDARHFAHAGVPVAMYGAGPRTLLEANGHRANERVALKDLRLATKVIAGALYDLLRMP